VIPWSGWLHSHDGHVAVLQVAAFVVCVAVAGRPLLQSWRSLAPKVRWSLLGLGVASVLISTVGFPLERFDALGHEASYYEVYFGASAPANAHGWQAYVTYPLLRWIYWGVGGIVGRDSGPLPLLILNASARGVAVVLVGWLAGVVMVRSSVVVAAAVLLCINPVHAFWGAAIYNVSLPFSAALLCLVCATAAWRSGDARLLAAAAASGSLVAALRVEWALLAPMLVLLLASLGPEWGRSPRVWRLRFWAPAIAVVVAYGSTLLGSSGAIAEHGGYYGVSGYLESIGRQVLFLDVFDLWGGAWALATVGFGLFAGSRGPGGRLRRPAGLVAFVVLGHLVLATFNDYSYRHALLPTIGLILAAAASASLLRDSDRRRAIPAAILLAGVVGASLLGLAEARSLYYASEEAFFERVEGFRGDRLEASSVEDGSCYLITDSERLWDMQVAGSHFNLMDPGEAVTHYRAHDGCVLWLFDRSQWVWDSLGPRVRAGKMWFWFSWEPQGWVEFPDGLVAVVYRMSEPPWGVGDDQPIPETEFNLGDDDDASEVPPPERGVESAP